MLLHSGRPKKKHKPSTGHTKGSDMRSAALCIAFLTAAGMASHAMARGQDMNADKALVLKNFWQQVYPNGGKSLHCDTPFTSGNIEGLSISHLYGEKQLKTALGCMTDTQCAVKTPRYVYMVADMHNLYPVNTRVEQGRRNASFGSLADNLRQPDDLGCNTRTTFRIIEPNDLAKGNVARAYLYMYLEYGLPLSGQLDLLRQWNEQDPPDAEEKARNDLIEKAQGNRNRFIDNPELAASLSE